MNPCGSSSGRMYIHYYFACNFLPLHEEGWKSLQHCSNTSGTIQHAEQVLQFASNLKAGPHRAAGFAGA